MITSVQRSKGDGTNTNDEYGTPGGLVRVIKDVIYDEFPVGSPILEPCCGKGSIVRELEGMKYAVISNDYSYGGYDYLAQKDILDKYVVTNPPFCLWDYFVNKAKTHARKILFIGRINYMGTCGRYKKGVWNNLKHVYVFNRYPDYRTPTRADGKFYSGMLFTGWFLWDMEFIGSTEISVVDVSDYVIRRSV